MQSLSELRDMTSKPLDKILIFEPQYKSVIWGGSRIAALKGEPCEQPRIGESWEISAIEGYESVVSTGPLKGTTITELAKNYGTTLLGHKVVACYGKAFPLLVKLIDAHDILSLQVHPNDEIAGKRHNTNGKSEMWYVIDAEPGATIYCGLSSPLTPDSLDEHIRDKSIMTDVKSYKTSRGQFYFIPAGTLHSIGAGNLLAEIQDSSDITYRVYDHDRTDDDGKPRQLHRSEAREAIDFTYPKTVEPIAKVFDSSTVDAVRSEHFTVDYFNIDSKEQRICTSDDSFTVIIVTSGSLTINADGETMTLTAGHTALIPACVKDLSLRGTGIAVTSRI